MTLRSSTPRSPSRARRRNATAARTPLNLLSSIVVSLWALAFVLWVASLDVGTSGVYG